MFSCSDPNQNELLQDTCISVEDGNPHVWLSPDIILNDPTFQPSISPGLSKDTAQQGADNQVSVRARKSCNPGGTTNVIVELWVAHPGLTFAPNVNSTLIFQTSIPTSSFALNTSIDPVKQIAQVTQTWTASDPIPSPPTNPDPDPNCLHRCLMARCYPANLEATLLKFCRNEDQHVAQRNIAIIPVSMKKLSLNFAIQTIGNNPAVPEAVLIRTIADRTPSEAVLKAILPSLERFPGYRQLASIVPKRFALEIPDHLSPVIRDYTRIDVVRPDIPSLPPIRFPEIIRYINRDIAGRSFRFRNTIFSPEAIAQEKLLAPGFGRPTAVQLAAAKIPTYEADIQLPPGEVVEINLNIDLPASSQVGDAHVFHATQINTNKQVVGGMTVIAVVVNPANIEAADGLANKRDDLVKSGYLAIFGSSSGLNQRRYAMCLRDLVYYLNVIIQSCRQDSVQPLDSFLSGVRELNAALGYSNSWFVTFYQSVKNNHGLTGEAATVANSYLDYAINYLS